MAMSEKSSPLILGIDAGTSRVRALVLSPTGDLLSEGQKAAITHRPKVGWAEQDAEAIWLACCHAIKTAIDGIDHPERILGMAIGSVGEAFVPLDQQGQPTYPVIQWYDERPTPQLQTLIERISQEQLFSITGLSADPTFTLLKLLWLRTNAPEALARTRTILNVTHYLAWRLTGVPGSDHSQASRSLAFDLHKRTWAEDLIRECDIEPALFQDLRPLGARLGSVLPEIAAGLGLSTACSVGVGGHDHLIGALAADALNPGTMLNSLGTAEAVTRALKRSVTDPKLMQRGYSQGVLIQGDRPITYAFGGFQTSGASIEWFRSLFAQGQSHDALIKDAQTVPPGSEGVTFLPDLRGKVVPSCDPMARGAWFGLNADAGSATLYRAILEGLAFEARQSVEALDDIDGVHKIDSIKAIGGNTRNALLLQIKASVYQQPIIVNEIPEATALGAALLGGMAAGLWPDIATALRGLRLQQRRIDPVDAWIEIYDQRYQQVFLPAYSALKPLHHAAHRLMQASET